MSIIFLHSALKLVSFGHVAVKYYIIFYKHVELVTGKRSCNNSTYIFICSWSVKLEQINSIAREDLPKGNDFFKDCRFGQALATT